jgi:hypothetical protein
MKDIMTLTLSNNKPLKTGSGEYTVGEEVTIFQNETDGTYGYRYQGINHQGNFYQSQNFTGFETKQAAMKQAIDNYNIGTGC